MKIAVFGGSGFLGYDFVRHVLDAGDIEPVVYSSSAKSLSNVARHDVDIRLYPAQAPDTVALDADVAAVVNFSHPFETRGGISGREQVARFAAFAGAAKQRLPALRLVHLSSMSVYEPFAAQRHFTEDSPLSPPRGDRYAGEKLAAETALRALPGAATWQLHLRPTVVYGPFCGVWTDRIFETFRVGDAGHHSLGGRIQPIYGEDVSRFIHARLRDGASGVYNLPGPEEMSWAAFLGVFRDIVGHGRLVPLAAGAANGEPSRLTFYRDNLRELMHAMRREPAFDRIALSIAAHLPERAVQRIRRLLLGRQADVAAPAATAATTAVVDTRYARGFFGEDRLVARERVCASFADFRPRRLDQMRATLAAYHRYRFTDEKFI